ncbi:hypothetical protein ACFL0Q_02040 [Thermodesulfobacteriota bacterium]
MEHSIHMCPRMGESVAVRTGLMRPRATQEGTLNRDIEHMPRGVPREGSNADRTGLPS